MTTSCCCSVKATASVTRFAEACPSLRRMTSSRGKHYRIQFTGNHTDMVCLRHRHDVLPMSAADDTAITVPKTAGHQAVSRRQP